MISCLLDFKAIEIYSKDHYKVPYVLRNSFNGNSFSTNLTELTNYFVNDSNFRSNVYPFELLWLYALECPTNNDNKLGCTHIPWMDVSSFCPSPNEHTIQEFAQINSAIIKAGKQVTLNRATIDESWCNSWRPETFQAHKIINSKFNEMFGIICGQFRSNQPYINDDSIFENADPAIIIARIHLVSIILSIFVFIYLTMLSLISSVTKQKHFSV